MLFLAIIGALASMDASAAWHYQSKKNEMTDQVDGGAFVVSKNTQSFKFPYAGGTSAMLAIVKKGDAIHVRVDVDKGQFSCGDPCTLSMRLDDSPAESWDASPSNDGSSNTLFFDDDSVAVKIAMAKRVRIQAIFYQEGQRMFEFDTRGLRWPLTFTK